MATHQFNTYRRVLHWSAQIDSISLLPLLLAAACSIERDRAYDSPVGWAWAYAERTQGRDWPRRPSDAQEKHMFKSVSIELCVIGLISQL